MSNINLGRDDFNKCVWLPPAPPLPHTHPFASLTLDGLYPSQQTRLSHEQSDFRPNFVWLYFYSTLIIRLFNHSTFYHSTFLSFDLLSFDLILYDFFSVSLFYSTFDLTLFHSTFFCSNLLLGSSNPGQSNISSSGV